MKPLNEEFAKLVRDLISEIKQVPYLCGRPECQSPGCLALRRAREIIRELENNHGRSLGQELI
jgi:hypothetical protein